ncbi:MAG: hypothetical protein JSS83_07685 [Cyanobacteria bacterium SZAS LIN-3]|nr:hypothetical protein [Cyanobacteria bacterium SZAS LIN-3]MBS2005445.1 hypothetical protein [Cyanobacteria bacterium SZAS TMP-1]
MSIYIGKLEFEGCFAGLEQIENDPGIYAVLVRENDDYQILEMGECEAVHDYLVQRVSGPLSAELEGQSFELAVYYTDDLAPQFRKQLLDEVLSEFSDAEDAPVAVAGNVLAFSR